MFCGLIYRRDNRKSINISIFDLYLTGMNNLL